MNRRKLLSVLSASPLLAKQAAAKQLATATIEKQASIWSQGLGSDATPFMPASLTPADYNILITLAKDQFEDVLYQGECKKVHYLDIDIANKRSFSLAAKIAFQRQRNVENTIKALTTYGTASPYEMVKLFIFKFLGKKA